MTDTQQFGGGDLGQPPGFDDGQGDGEGASQAALLQFLTSLEADLADIIRSGPPSTVEPAMQAFGRAQDQFDYLRRMLTENWDACVEPLSYHGLVGGDLVFKIGVWRAMRGKYQEASIAPGDAIDQAAKDYLEVSDIILESLSDSLGGGAAIIELKKFIEWIRGAWRRWFDWSENPWASSR